MKHPTVISFVRHGHVYNPQNVFYGRLPGFPLSEEGRNQAQAAAQALCDKPLAAIFSSELLRTRETARIIRASHGNLPIHISKLITESRTPFDGRPFGEVVARGLDVYTGFGPPYEQPIDVVTRVRQFITGVRQQYTGQHVVAVTHGDVIAFAILWAGGLPATPQGRLELGKAGLRDDYPAPGSITNMICRPTRERPDIEYWKPSVDWEGATVKTPETTEQLAHPLARRAAHSTVNDPEAVVGRAVAYARDDATLPDIQRAARLVPELKCGR